MAAVSFWFNDYSYFIAMFVIDYYEDTRNSKNTIKKIFIITFI